jgi:serine/threonine protein phosphatase PrpC
MEPTPTREGLAQSIVDLVVSTFPATAARETLLVQARALVDAAQQITAPEMDAMPETHQKQDGDTLAASRDDTAAREPSALPSESVALMAQPPAQDGVSEAAALAQPPASDTAPSEASFLEPSPSQPDSHPMMAEIPAPEGISETASLQPDVPDTVPSETPSPEPYPSQPDNHAPVAETTAVDGASEAMQPQPQAQNPGVALLRPGEIPATTLPVVPVPPPRVDIIITNAKAGEPYRSHVLAHAEAGEARVLDCEIPAEAMVSFQDGHLCGESPRAGEYDIQVSVAVGTSEPPRIVRTEARLVVNPDPRSLWKTIPSDRDVPGWKPDSAHTLLAGAGDRRLVIASQRGRSHAHTGAPRDDDYAVRASAADGWNVLAVADGAGSAERSRIGSRVACETAVEVAAAKLAETAAQWPLDRLETPLPADLRQELRNLAYTVLSSAVFDAVKAIVARGEVQGYPARAYATTLLLALHRPLQDSDLIVTIGVGDGAIGLLETDGTGRLLGAPDCGAYAGQTRFLDQEVVTDGAQIMRRIQVAVVPRLEALILMSDGVSDPMFPSDAALHDTTYWRDLWGELQPRLDRPDASERLLEWLDFWSNGNHDDRTVAILF